MCRSSRLTVAGETVSTCCLVQHRLDSIALQWWNLSANSANWAKCTFVSWMTDKQTKPWQLSGLCSKAQILCFVENLCFWNLLHTRKLTCSKSPSKFILFVYLFSTRKPSCMQRRTGHLGTFIQWPWPLAYDIDLRAWSTYVASSRTGMPNILNLNCADALFYINYLIFY